MPQRPDVSDGHAIEIDVDQKYIVEVNDIEEIDSTFPDAKPGDKSLIWKWRIYDMATGVALTDLNSGGMPYELWQFTNDKTYKNQKSGKVAVAREFAEALLGRDLSDDEVNDLIDEGFKEALVGRKGIADLDFVTGKNGKTRLKIIRLRPYKKGKAAPAAAPERELMGAVAAPAKKKFARDDDEDEAQAA